MTYFPPRRHRSARPLAVLGLTLFALVAVGCTYTPRVYKTKADYADPYRTAEIHYAHGYNAGWDHVKGLCEYHPHHGDVPGYAGDAWRHGYHRGVNRLPGHDPKQIHAWVDEQPNPEPAAPTPETPGHPESTQSHNATDAYDTTPHPDPAAG
ncbi:MAG: hypothetical protein AAF333_09310 [Planctomycetota bacterium]